MLLRMGNRIAAAELLIEASHMEALLNSDNDRAEVWQNLKEAIGDVEKDAAEESEGSDK